jgi:hypothetical protein
MQQFGGKDSKRHFTVVMGGKEHGLYVSSSPSSAAKKAVTKLCAANKSKKVEFHIREITQGSKKKTYGPYSGYIEKLKEPIELKGRVIKYKPVAKLSGKTGVKKGGGWEDDAELQMDCWIYLGHDAPEITNQPRKYNGFGKLKIDYDGIFVDLSFDYLNDVEESEAFIIDKDKNEMICDVYLLYKYHLLDGRLMLSNNKNGKGNNKEAVIITRLQLAEFGLINLKLVATRNFFKNIVDNQSLLNQSSIQQESDEAQELLLRKIKKKILLKRREFPTFCDYILKNQLSGVESLHIDNANENENKHRIMEEEKRRKNMEERKRRENMEERQRINMEERQRRRNGDMAAIKKISEEMRTNRMEHNIKIYNVKETNKHESGVIFEDVIEEKKYFIGSGQIEFAQQIFELFTERKFYSNTKEITFYVNGDDYLNLILTLKKNAKLLE